MPDSRFGVALAALILAGMLAPALAEEPAAPPEVRAVMDRARAIHDLGAPGSAPFHLEAAYRQTAPGGRILTGTIVLHWKAPDAWRREITVGDARFVTVRSGATEYRLGRGPVSLDEALVESGLDGGWNLAARLRLTPEETATLARKALADGREVVTVSLGPAADERLRAFGFDAASGALEGESDAWGRLATIHSEMRDGRRVPVRIETYQDKKQSSLWVLTSFSAWQPPDETLLSPPPGAVALAVCGEKEHPKLEKQVNPKYPPDALARGLGGRAEFDILLGADGNILEIRASRSTDPMFEEAALAALRRWKYEMPKCMSDRGPLLWWVRFAFKPGP